MWLPRVGGVSGVVLTATVSRFRLMSLLVCPLLVVAANHVGRSDFTYSGAEAAVRCSFARARRLLRSIVDGIVVVVVLGPTVAAGAIIELASSLPHSHTLPG
jgi:hypothetical protein